MLYYMLYYWQTSVANLCHYDLCSCMLPYAMLILAGKIVAYADVC